MARPTTKVTAAEAPWLSDEPWRSIMTTDPHKLRQFYTDDQTVSHTVRNAIGDDCEFILMKAKVVSGDASFKENEERYYLLHPRTDTKWDPEVWFKDLDTVDWFVEGGMADRGVVYHWRASAWVADVTAGRVALPETPAHFSSSAHGTRDAYTAFREGLARPASQGRKRSREALEGAAKKLLEEAKALQASAAKLLEEAKNM